MNRFVCENIKDVKDIMEFHNIKLNDGDIHAITSALERGRKVSLVTIIRWAIFTSRPSRILVSLYARLEKGQDERYPSGTTKGARGRVVSVSAPSSVTSTSSSMRMPPRPSR